MDSKLHTYTDVKKAVNRMLESSNVVRGSSTEHILSILEQKWASVYSKIQERKVTFFLFSFCLKTRVTYFYPNATYTRIKVKFAGFGDRKKCNMQRSMNMINELSKRKLLRVAVLTS